MDRIHEFAWTDRRVNLCLIQSRGSFDSFPITQVFSKMLLQLVELSSLVSSYKFWITVAENLLRQPDKFTPVKTQLANLPSSPSRFAIALNVVECTFVPFVPFCRISEFPVNICVETLRIWVPALPVWTTIPDLESPEINIQMYQFGRLVLEYLLQLYHSKPRFLQRYHFHQGLHLSLHSKLR